MELLAATAEHIEFPNLFSGDIMISRVAFTVFGIDIYWYGLLIAVGVVLGFIYAMKRAPQFGVLADTVFDVAFIGVIGGFIGARAYYCIFHNLHAAEGEMKYTFITAITEVRDGGLAIYGGIIGAVLFAFIYTRIRKIRLLPIMDLAGLGFFIGQGIGRWGNFVNQEAFGAPTATTLPWGMTGTLIVDSPNYRQAINDMGVSMDALVHPCFLYESLWCAIGLVLLHFYSKKFRTFDGEIFLLYAVWYGAGRAYIEGFRLDSLYIGDFRVSQLVGIAAAVLGTALFVFLKIRAKRNPAYVMYSSTEESKKVISDFDTTRKLTKEQRKAKKEIEKAEKEKNKPVAPSILGDAVFDGDEDYSVPMVDSFGNVLKDDEPEEKEKDEPEKSEDKAEEKDGESSDENIGALPEEDIDEKETDKE